MTVVVAFVLTEINSTVNAWNSVWIARFIPIHRYLP